MTPLLRLYVRVPNDYVANVRRTYGENGQKQLLWEIDQRIQRLGFGAPLSVMQDPTDNTLVRVIARTYGRPASSDGVLYIQGSERVQEPPEYVVDPSLPKNILDHGLTRGEAWMIRQALLKETNARHVDGIASTLEPFFPISASLLRSKSMMLEARAFANRQSILEAQAAIASGLQKKGFKVEPIPTRTGDELAEIVRYETDGRWTDVEAKLRSDAAVLPPTWIPTAALSEQPIGTDLLRLRQAAFEEGMRRGLSKEAIELEVKRVACFICEYPLLLLTNNATRHELESFPPAFVEAARSVVREIGPGMIVVDPKRLEVVTPPKEQDGFVSPTAFQMALSNAKPEMADVFDKRRAKRIFQEIGEGGSAGETNARKRAQLQLERASRMLERRRWVDWYYRRKLAYGENA